MGRLWGRVVKFVLSALGPRVLPVQILGADMAPFIMGAEAASHMPQLEGPTTKTYNYVLGGFGEKKQKKKSRKLATVVSSGANL